VGGYCPVVAQPKKKKLNWKFLFVLFVPLLWGWLSIDGDLKILENIVLDLRFRFRGPLAVPVKVFYVDVDTRTVQLIGERPWNRARFAAAGQLLMEKGGAKSVGFDFVFSDLGHSDLVNKEEATKGNYTLARVAKQHPEIVLAAQYTGGEARTQQGTRKFPLLRQGFANPEKNDIPELPVYPIVNPASSATIGLIDIDFEYAEDQVPRWAPLFAESSITTFWHLSLQLACIELGLPPGSFRRDGDFLDIVAPDGKVVRHIPLTEQQLLEVNWFSKWDTHEYNPRSSMADVLLAGEGLQSEKPEERAEAEAYFKRFAGATVLIGPVDPMLQDLAPTPFDRDPVPKVGGHGSLIKTILSEQYLIHTPSWFLWVCTFGLSIVVTGLTVRGGSKSLLNKVIAVLVLAGYAIACLVVFAQNHLIVPMVAPIGAAFSTGFIATLWQLVQEEKQKGRIKSMFGTYLAPELVNQMVESHTDPQLGGHEEIITAYFSDIQEFSTFSEVMTPKKLVELMNEYLTACTDIVQEEKGTLDKYIGDAVVTIFGAPLPVPDHAYRACVAAVRVQQKIDELRAKWSAGVDSEGKPWHEKVHKFRARLGLNTGPVIVGNMGSRTRFSYTMMGDNVNLAARMESGAKAWGAFTMVTEATKLECEKHGGDHVVFRQLAKIVVKGRSIPVNTYEVTGLKETVTAQTRECLRIFGEGLACYYARDWDGALRLFEQSALIEPLVVGVAPGVKGNPSTIYIEICKEYRRSPPPADWDGVYVMHEK
jgi:adenylate cyclase